MIRHFIYILFIGLSLAATAQERADVLTFSEYLGFIKKHHPIVKQANLMIPESEAKLLKARGGFDPKVEVDFSNKNFKGTEYYNKLNGVFKIPTWYGIEIKGGYENNSGPYLNPESGVPDNGLYTAGVSIPLLRGLLMNDRMATLKQAKLYQKQALSDNQLLVNEILYNASLAYFDWYKCYREKEVYEQFLDNAETRFQGIKSSFRAGEVAAIDTTEARIALNNRKLSLEKATLNYIKATLALSNYLWINDVPVEIQETIRPDEEVANTVDNDLQLDIYTLGNDIANHPKLRSLDFKYQGLEVERRLQKNNMLPKVDVQYNFLTTPDALDAISTSNYKAGISVSMPLLFRKERADLRLTDFKLQAIELENQATTQVLENKLKTVEQEIESYERQVTSARTIVSDYTIMLDGEERKFETGDSSLFLINTRESKLIESKLKAIELEYILLTAKGKLFNVLGL